MLQGTRVLDLSHDVAGAYAARLFAVYGADVIQVEPPQGHPTRHLPPAVGDGPDDGLLFAYLGAGKRSVVLDLDQSADRERLLRLARTVDVVFDGYPPGWLAERGIDLPALCAERPALVVVSITPFGQDGPHAAWRTTSLTAAAAGGQLALCGDPDAPPLKTAGHQPYYQSGLHGFSAAATALWAARRTGLGDHVDISLQEAQASALEGAGPTALTRGTDAERAGNGVRAMFATYQCADGWIGVYALARQYDAIFDGIGHPEFKQQPALRVTGNPEANAILTEAIHRWAMAHTRDEVLAIADRLRAPFSLTLSPRDLLAWPSLLESAFWQHVDHPRIGRHVLPSGPITIGDWRGEQRRAPLLGEHTHEVFAALDALDAPRGPDAAGETRGSGTSNAAAARGAPRPPLDGVTVLDLTQVWAGPFGSRFLGDMGADVIHIEGPTFPDAVRWSGVGVAEERLFDRSSYFNEYNRNKRGLALDLRHPQGLAAFRRMAARADVVIENWSAGVPERLGIGYEALRAINPRIVMVSMPGFGLRGSEAHRVAYGPAIEQMGGLPDLQGYVDGPPHKSGISYGDPTAGTLAAGAVALGLLQRDASGEGCQVVVTQRDNIIGLIGEYLLAESIGRPIPTRLGNGDLVCAPHNVYRARPDGGRLITTLSGDPRTSDETWLAIAVDGDQAWHALRDVVRDPRLDDPRYRTAEGRRDAAEAIDAALAQWAAAQDPHEAAHALQDAGVSAVPVMTPLTLLGDEHLHARGFFAACDHPIAGTHLTTRPVWRFARRPFAGARPAPCFGQHNAEVLTALAGCTAEQVAELERLRVISDHPLAM